MTSAGDPFVGERVRLRGPRIGDREHVVRLDGQIAGLRTGSADAAVPTAEVTPGEWERRLTETE